MPIFDVKMRCVIIKSVTCEAPTADAALADPWQYAVDELEIDQEDFMVLSIKEEK
jgi:hypothetical protein